MEETIEAYVPPEVVWAAWEKAHQGGRLESGQKGKKGLKYQILDVKRGESFTILWKSLFARLLFFHSVKSTAKGSRIQYGFQIKGPFAWPLRWMLEKKIRKNLATVLSALAKQLEYQSKT